MSWIYVCMTGLVICMGAYAYHSLKNIRAMEQPNLEQPLNENNTDERSTDESIFSRQISQTQFIEALAIRLTHRNWVGLSNLQIRQIKQAGKVAALLESVKGLARSDTHLYNLDQTVYDEYWNQLIRLIMEALTIRPSMIRMFPGPHIFNNRVDMMRKALLKVPINMSGNTSWDCWLKRAVEEMQTKYRSQQDLQRYYNTCHGDCYTRANLLEFLSNQEYLMTNPTWNPEYLGSTPTWNPE